MSASFADSNVVLYLASDDQEKAIRVKRIVAGDLMISAQVLNEIANVFRKKWGRSWPETQTFLAVARGTMKIVPVTLETHVLGIRIAQRHQLSVYDSMIVAAALLAGCEILYSEDMHAGLLLEGQLKIVNPFRDG